MKIKHSVINAFIQETQTVDVHENHLLQIPIESKLILNAFLFQIEILSLLTSCNNSAFIDFFRDVSGG